MLIEKNHWSHKVILKRETFQLWNADELSALCFTLCVEFFYQLLWSNCDTKWNEDQCWTNKVCCSEYIRILCLSLSENVNPFVCHNIYSMQINYYANELLLVTFSTDNSSFLSYWGLGSTVHHLDKLCHFTKLSQSEYQIKLVLYVNPVPTSNWHPVQFFTV